MTNPQALLARAKIHEHFMKRWFSLNAMAREQCSWQTGLRPLLGVNNHASGKGQGSAKMQEGTGILLLELIKSAKVAIKKT
eukprot:1099467-Pleurochrysis_carterae.AAC.1